MSYNSKKIKYLREKVKDITQVKMGEYLNLERGTYAAKEAKGDFTPGQFATILKRFGMTEEQFDQFQLPGASVVGIYTPELLVTIEAKIDVALSVLGELLAKANGQSVIGVSNELSRAVKERYDQKISESLKSGLQQ